MCVICVCVGMRDKHDVFYDDITDIMFTYIMQYILHTHCEQKLFHDIQ